MITVEGRQEDADAGEGSIRVIRLGFLTVVALTLAMIGVRVALYPPVLGQPRAVFSVFAPTGALLAYAVVAGAISSRATPDLRIALRIGTEFGLVSGIVSVAHLLQETYLTLPAGTTATVTWIFILAMFVPWALAAYGASQRTRRSICGVLAGVWSSAVCMVLTLSFGFGQLLTSLPRLQEHDAGSPDFLRSGWSDLRAFVILDVFEAGFWIPQRAEVSKAGDLGYTTGTNAITVPAADGRTTTLEGRYVTVWKRGPDGRWRCVVDSWSPAASRAAAGPK